MRSTILFALAAGSALAATPALAQDADAPYSGAWVGASFGYDVQPNDIGERIFFDRNLDGNFNEPVRTAAGADAFSPGFCNGRYRGAVNVQGCTNDRDNLSYYVRGGVDQQYGNLVIGAMAEFGKSDIRDYVTAFSTTPASYTFERSIDYTGSLKARAGYAAGTTLFYGNFGATYAEVDHQFYTSNTANSFTPRGKDGQFGYTAGGGVETRVGEHFTFGLEYSYNVINDDDQRVRVGAGTAPATNPFVLAPNTSGTDLARSDDRFRWHSMRVTAGYRF